VKEVPEAGGRQGVFLPHFSGRASPVDPTQGRTRQRTERPGDRGRQSQPRGSVTGRPFGREQDTPR